MSRAPAGGVCRAAARGRRGMPGRRAVTRAGAPERPGRRERRAASIATETGAGRRRRQAPSGGQRHPRRPQLVPARRVARKRGNVVARKRRTPGRHGARSELGRWSGRHDPVPQATRDVRTGAAAESGVDTGAGRRSLIKPSSSVVVSICGPEARRAGVASRARRPVSVHAAGRRAELFSAAAESVSPCICLHIFAVCPSVCLSVCLSVRPPVCPSDSLPVCSSVLLSVLLSVRPSARLSVCLPVSLFLSLSVCL